MGRRKYTREFKLSAVKLVNEQGYSPVEAAKSLGVDPNSVTILQVGNSVERMAAIQSGSVKASIMSPDFVPQLTRLTNPDPTLVWSAVRRVIRGLFKKICIAPAGRGHQGLRGRRDAERSGGRVARRHAGVPHLLRLRGLQ